MCCWEETRFRRAADSMRHSKPGSVKGVWGYKDETSRGTEDMSTCSVFSVGQCSKDSYPRKMTACINKCLLKFILLENCFSSLPSGLIERKQRLRKRKWSNKQSQNFSFSGWLQSLKFIRDSSRTGIPKPEPRRICYVTRWSPDVVWNGKSFSPFTLLTED